MSTNFISVGLACKLNPKPQFVYTHFNFDINFKDLAGNIQALVAGLLVHILYLETERYSQYTCGYYLEDG